MYDYMDHFHVRTFPEVIQKINRIYRLDPERFEKLREGMTGLRSGDIMMIEHHKPITERNT